MATRRDWDDQAGMAVGVGYDAVSGNVCGDCVVRSDLEGEGGEDVYFAVDMVSSREELARFMNISASASLKYAVFSGGGKTRYFAEQKIYKYSLYIVVACVVQHSAKRMRDVELTANAKQLLAIGNTEKFRQRCGDEFLVGYTSGGEFYGIYEFATKSEDEHRTMSQTLRGSGGYGAWSGSGSASFEAAIRKLSETLSMTFRMYAYGGQSDDPLPHTAGELIDYARKFPQLVRGTAAKKYVATFHGYDTLELPDGPNLVDIQDKRDVLEWLGTQRLRYLDVISSVEYVLFNPEQFEPFDTATLNAKVNELRSAVDSIVSAASRCVNDYRQCDRISLPDPSVLFPARRDSTVIGALRFVQEAAGRAEHHGRACNDHAQRVVQIGREIKAGPTGKSMADKARTELTNARQSASLAERAYEDASTADRVENAEIERLIATAKSWTQRANGDVELAKRKYELEVYPIGYAPYWKGPTVVHMDPGYVDPRGWTFAAHTHCWGWYSAALRPVGWKPLNGGRPVSADRNGGGLTIDQLSVDPAGGTVVIKPACSAPIAGGDPYDKKLHCSLQNLPTIRSGRDKFSAGVTVADNIDPANTLGTGTNFTVHAGPHDYDVLAVSDWKIMSFQRSSYWNQQKLACER